MSRQRSYLRVVLGAAMIAGVGCTCAEPLVAPMPGGGLVWGESATARNACGSLCSAEQCKLPSPFDLEVSALTGTEAGASVIAGGIARGRLRYVGDDVRFETAPPCVRAVALLEGETVAYVCDDDLNVVTETGVKRYELEKGLDPVAVHAVTEGGAVAWVLVYERAGRLLEFDVRSEQTRVVSSWSKPPRRIGRSKHFVVVELSLLPETASTVRLLSYESEPRSRELLECGATASIRPFSAGPDTTSFLYLCPPSRVIEEVTLALDGASSGMTRSFGASLPDHWPAHFYDAAVLSAEGTRRAMAVAGFEDSLFVLEWDAVGEGDAIGHELAFESPIGAIEILENEDGTRRSLLVAERDRLVVLPLREDGGLDGATHRFRVEGVDRGRTSLATAGSAFFVVDGSTIRIVDRMDTRAVVSVETDVLEARSVAPASERPFDRFWVSSERSVHLLEVDNGRASTVASVPIRGLSEAVPIPGPSRGALFYGDRIARVREVREELVVDVIEESVVDAEVLGAIAYFATEDGRVIAVDLAGDDFAHRLVVSASSGAIRRLAVTPDIDGDGEPDFALARLDTGGLSLLASRTGYAPQRDVIDLESVFGIGEPPLPPVATVEISDLAFLAPIDGRSLLAIGLTGPGRALVSSRTSRVYVLAPGPEWMLELGEGAAIAGTVDTVRVERVDEGVVALDGARGALELTRAVCAESTGMP